MVRGILWGLLFSTASFLMSCGASYNLQQIEADVVVERRDILVDPQAEEFRPTAKLLFVVDNSASMKDEQALLAHGISSTFEQLKGYNLDIYVLTTSSSNASETVAKSAVQIDKFRDNGDGIFLPMVGADPNPALSNKNMIKKRVYKLKTVTPDGEALQLRRTMSVPEMDGVKDNLVSLISSIGTDGSDTESGYCTALRALIESRGDDHLLVAGDRVALVVISDDNDYSTLSDCSAEESDFYRWVAPVTSIRGVSANAQNTNYYGYSTSWGPREAYQLDIGYTDANNPGAYWALSTIVAQTEAVFFDYTYKADVNNDGQISTVTYTASNQQFAFSSADAGYPNLSTSTQTCTPKLLEMAKARASYGREQNVTRCVYVYTGATNTQYLTTPLAGMGTQSSSVSCSSQVTSDLLNHSTQYPALLPSGKRFVSCSYFYRSAASKVKTTYLTAVPPGVNFTSGTLNCPSSPALESYATSKLAELATSGEAPVYTSCTLRTRSATRTCSFDDVKLDALPSGSTIADLPNQCSNANLKVYIASPRSSCTAAQLDDLVLYGCNRTAKTTATESYTSQAAKFDLVPASSVKKSALEALEERVGIVAIPGVSESVRMSSSIQAAARNLFGQSGFFFSAIIKPADISACPGQIPGDGERYRSLAMSLGAMGSATSICADSYGPALENISNFIVRVLNNAYAVKLKETEEIEDVVLQRGSLLKLLLRDQDFQAVGGTITFKPDVLELGDKIQVRVKNTYKVKAKLD